MKASSPNRNGNRDDSVRVPPRQKQKHDKKPDKIISQLFEDPHPSPFSLDLKSSPGASKWKSPVEGKMADAILDRLSTLLMSGCSIQLACNEVHFFSANCCFQPFLFHAFYYDRSKYFQVGLARTTFYRWLERIRRMQADSSWASVSESYRMFVLKQPILPRTCHLHF